MDKTSTIDTVLNLEQAAQVTRLYLSRVAAAQTAEALRARCRNGTGPPTIPKKGPSNARVEFRRSEVVAWCLDQLPERHPEAEEVWPWPPPVDHDEDVLAWRTTHETWECAVRSGAPGCWLDVACDTIRDATHWRPMPPPPRLGGGYSHR